MSAVGTPGGFSGEIVVGSRIIDNLSSGLYNSPASCLKELVNNAYDADATVVDILVKPDADYIAILDNGTGMSRSEFEKNFSRVSESYKRVDSDYTASGRPKIGKIGIGFIAANELCDIMEIHSTKSGSTELLKVEINFAVMRTKTVDERHLDKDDYKKGDYIGEVFDGAAEDEHYTRIFLNGVREEARKMFAGVTPDVEDGKTVSLYGCTPDLMANKLAKLSSWTELDHYSQTMVKVALNVPVPYADHWIPEEHTTAVSDIVDRVESYNFTVRYDGTVLKKPVVLGALGKRNIVRSLRFEGEHVSAEGYLFAQHGTINPKDLNGVLIRIRNSAVGDYDDGFMGFPKASGQLFQKWITGEIYADDRLEDALNIERRTLRETHDAYVELRNWFIEELHDFLTPVRGLYTQEAARRKETRAGTEAKAVREVAARAERLISPAVRDEILTAVVMSPKSSRTSMRPPTFTVSEVFDVAVETAAEVLPRELAEKYIQALAQRLGR